MFRKRDIFYGPIPSRRKKTVRDLVRAPRISENNGGGGFVDRKPGSAGYRERKGARGLARGHKHTYSNIPSPNWGFPETDTHTHRRARVRTQAKEPGSELPTAGRSLNERRKHVGPFPRTVRLALARPPRCAPRRTPGDTSRTTAEHGGCVNSCALAILT